MNDRLVSASPNIYISKTDQRHIEDMPAVIKKEKKRQNAQVCFTQRSFFQLRFRRRLRLLLSTFGLNRLLNSAAVFGSLIPFVLKASSGARWERGAREEVTDTSSLWCEFTDSIDVVLEVVAVVIVDFPGLLGFTLIISYSISSCDHGIMGSIMGGIMVFVVVVVVVVVG